MSQYTSYYLYQKYVKYGDQDWLPAYPNVFSVDGNGTMPTVIKQNDDPGCGYTPPAEYRWVNLDPDTDYFCDECGGSASTKVSGTYGESGETFETSCDASTQYFPSYWVSKFDVPSGVTFAKIGTCATHIGGYESSFGNGPFEGKPGLIGVSIPNTVTSIDSLAFADSYALVDCILPDTITTIPQGAFSGCTSLSNFVLWDTVTSIGDRAFSECDSLISINIPSGLTSISNYCFAGCGGLSEITIPSGVTSIGYRAFMNCSGLTSIICLATVPPTLGSSAFTNTADCPIYVPCECIDDYINASGWNEHSLRITGIPPCGQYGYKLQALFTDGDTLDIRCNSATTLNTGDTHSGSAYYLMASATIGSCIKVIGRLAFSNCEQLSSCTIEEGSQLEEIGYRSFFNCSKLTSLVINVETPPALDSTALTYTSNNLIIYVPSSAVESYKTANVWSNYASRIQAITS